MMILSAVVLLVGFVALAGMVARVNQLGTQTTTESRKSVLTESTSLQDGLDLMLSSTARRVATVTVAVTSGVVTATVTSPANPPGFFSVADVGMPIAECTSVAMTTCGGQSHVPAGTTITGVASPTSATLSGGTAGAGVIVKVSRTGFALDGTTSPRVSGIVAAALEQMQRAEAEKGFLMGYDLMAGYYNPSTGAFVADCSNAQVVLRLADGDVKVEMRSTVFISRAAGCADVSDSFFPFP